MASSGSGGGYDYQFVDGPPQDFLFCKICLLVSHDPYLSVCCGHVFCKSCIDNTKRNTAIVGVCPVCRSEEFTTVVNKQVDRLVKSLRIFCTNRDKGCNWQGELIDIDNHLSNSDGCQFEDVQCTNECGQVLKRHHLKCHLDSECPNRKIVCMYCHAKIQYKFINDKHKKECPKFPLPCPNKCKVDNILRENLQKHLGDECRLQNVECNNKCGVVLQRQNLTHHLKSECLCREVKCQYCDTKNTYKVIEGQHKKECPRFPISCANKCGVMILQQDVDKHNKVCPLERVHCIYHDVGCVDVILRKNQKKHNEETSEAHLQLLLLELTYTKQKFAATEQMHEETSEAHLQLLLSELTYTKQKLAATEQMLSTTNNKLADIQLELNSTKTKLNKIQKNFDKDLVDIKRDSAITSSKVNALEIVTHQNTKSFSNYFTISPREVITAANRSVYLSAMATLSKSDQPCPVFIKSQELAKLKENREIWYSNPFYLTKDKKCKVCLCIDASKWTCDQDPLLQLNVVDPCSNKSIQGELSLLLLNCNADNDDLNLISKKKCTVHCDQKVIFTTTLPVNNLPEKFVRNNSVIIMVSFDMQIPELLIFSICVIIILLLFLIFGFIVGNIVATKVHILK